MSLEMLKEAAQYVENHQRGCGNTVTDIDQASSIQSSPRKSSPEPAAKETGNADEQIRQNIRESMRVYNARDVTSADDGVAMSQYNNHSNGIYPRSVYTEERLTSPDARTVDTPKKLPERKRSSSSHSVSESEPQSRNMISQSTLPGPASLPMTQLPPAGHMVPLIHPYLYTAMDPTLYAELLVRRGFVTDGPRQAKSPTSSPNNCGLTIPGQTFQRLVNPGVFMTPRGTAPGIGLTDLPIAVPPQLAANYGQATSMLSHPLAAVWTNLSDTDRRLLEAAPQAIPEQFLTNPLLKGFYPHLDVGAGKDNVKLLNKSAVPTVPVMPTMAEHLFKYQGAVKNERKNESSRSSVSPASAHSTSPESNKKTSLPPGYPYPVHYANPYSKNSAKFPTLDRKPSIPQMRQVKTEALPVHYESRTVNSLPRKRDPSYEENHAMQIIGDDAGRKLAAISNRSPISQETSQPRHNSGHWSPSPSSPYGDRWNYRRTSRELSPQRSSTTAQKNWKKRSQEFYDRPLPQDLLRARNNRSPTRQPSAYRTRVSKSPPRSRSGSPEQRQAATNASQFLMSKTSHGMNEKDAAAYLAANPYMFHPTAFASYPFPFAALPQSLLRQADSPSTSRAVADAIAASSLAGSHLFRPQLLSETAVADYARLAAAGLQQYAPVTLLAPQQQQQQALRTTGLKQATPTVQDYTAAALKQAGLPPTLFIDPKDKDGIIAGPYSASVRHYLSNLPASSSKAAHTSPGLPGRQRHATTKFPAPFLQPQTMSSPGHVGAEGCSIKREQLSPPGKRMKLSASSPALGYQKVTIPRAYKSDEEDRIRLKRRSGEDVTDRSMKDASAKRRREIASDANANDIDEHFRRSLGDKYKNSDTSSKVSVTGLVEDHFQRALGNHWNKLITNNPPSSPEPSDARHSSLPRAENRITTSSNLPGYQTMSQLPVVVDPRLLAVLPHYSTLQRSKAENLTLKPGQVVVSDPMSDAAAARVISASNGRNDVCKASSYRLNGGESLPPPYGSISRVHSDASFGSASSISRSHSPTPPRLVNSAKKSLSPATAAASHREDNGLCLNLSASSRLLNNPLKYEATPLKRSPAPHPKSPPRPHAYSPQGGAPSSSVPPHPVSPRCLSGVAYPGDDQGITRHTPIQT